MNRVMKIGAHLFLCLFIIIMLLPIYLAVVAASHEGSLLMHTRLPYTPGSLFFYEYESGLRAGVSGNRGRAAI